MIGSATSNDWDEVVLRLTMSGSKIAGNDKYQVHSTSIMAWLPYLTCGGLLIDSPVLR